MTVFFEKLQDHSEVKVEILNRYYIPWLRKINLGNYNSRKCLVIDGFAGEGIYDDGKKGSPIILIDGAIDFINQLRSRNEEPANITIILVEQKIKTFTTLLDNITNLYEIDNKTVFPENENIIALQLKEYPTLKIRIVNDSFESLFTSLLDSIDNKKTLIPSFCFVDPFGFSYTPFELFQRYLENSKSELLFNFMYEEINRFIKSDKNKKLIETYQELFGISDIDELRNAIGDKKTVERKKIVMDFYSRKLLTETQAKYVLDFEIMKNGKAKMFLIYATKNIHGLKTMKDVMWKVDDTGAYMFDGRVSADQIEFDFTDSSFIDETRKKLAGIILSNFHGYEDVQLETLHEYVLTQTSFPITNYFKKALRLLEINGNIKVDRASGSKKGTFNEKKVKAVHFIEHSFGP